MPRDTNALVRTLERIEPLLPATDARTLDLREATAHLREQHSQLGIPWLPDLSGELDAAHVALAALLELLDLLAGAREWVGQYERDAGLRLELSLCFPTLILAAKRTHAHAYAAVCTLRRRERSLP